MFKSAARQDLMLAITLTLTVLRITLHLKFYYDITWMPNAGLKKRKSNLFLGTAEELFVLPMSS